ncbi:Hypp4256 [Branchiostoma lanceolatum]|uniref:Hypp4256 protein n=1 Tax=Branchiostoma lanceolatum TaxID=7740 RepID=A0A8K0F0X7_BRALA|nr:Hypp4256 [Branchiostoma lanceolatum]
MCQHGHADLVMLECDDFHLPDELDRLDIDFTECFIGDKGLDHVQSDCNEDCACDGVVDAWAIAQVLQPCTHCVDKMQIANSSSSGSRGESSSDGHSSAQLGDLSGIKSRELSEQIPANDSSECRDLSTCPSDYSEEQSSWSETCSGCTLCDAEFDLDLISLLTHGGSDAAYLPDKAVPAEEMVALWVQQSSERPPGHQRTCFYTYKVRNVLKTALQKTFLRKVKAKLQRPKQQKRCSTMVEDFS